MAILDNLQYKI